MFKEWLALPVCVCGAVEDWRMATLADRILEAIRYSPLDDDAPAGRLGLNSRQAVNQAAHRLEEKGLLLLLRIGAASTPYSTGSWAFSAPVGFPTPHDVDCHSQDLTHLLHRGPDGPLE